MSTLFLECDINSITLDEAAFPDCDDKHIYLHLKHCYERNRPSPVVTLSASRFPPVVVGGQKGFKIAKELGIGVARAVVHNHERYPEFQKFLRQPHVRVFDSEAITKDLIDTAILEMWHVFFFDQPLNEHAKVEFDKRIVSFFRNLNSGLLHGKARNVSQPTFQFDDTCAEFTATTPVGDEGWYGKSLVTLVDFSKNVAKIASYHGEKFKY